MGGGGEGPMRAMEAEIILDDDIDWGSEGWWEDAPADENYNPLGYRSGVWPYVNSRCPARSELSGQTPCVFECQDDYECPPLMLCCSNDCGRVCVTPDTDHGPTRCGCSATFLSDLDEYFSPPPDIATVANFAWNVLQGSLSPSLEPHLFFGSVVNRDWLGADVHDDCTLELRAQSQQMHYRYYDPFSMDTAMLFAVITKPNSTLMLRDMTYFPDIFDQLVVIKVGDVDPMGSLDGAVNHLIAVDTLDDLGTAVQEAKGYISEYCTCDDAPAVDSSCLEVGEPCDGDCDRFAFVCDEGTCQRDLPDIVPTTYKNFFGDYEDDYFYYDYYDYYYYDDYYLMNNPGVKNGIDPKNQKHKNGSQPNDGHIFPPLFKKDNNTQTKKPSENKNKKSFTKPTTCSKSIYTECEGYLSKEDKDKCKEKKARQNCTQADEGSRHKKLAIFDEGPNRYLYRTLDYTGHCAAGLFRCPGIPTLCLFGELLCNGEDNCMFGEDEDESFCSTRECSVTEFRCASGQCIRRSQECDGETDCSDGTDEHCAAASDCPAPRTHYCGAGACIKEAFLCDNILDCPHGEDEMPCNCTGFKCSSGECIDNYFLCNGRQDCSDGSDEADVCAGFTCSEGSFKCDSGECIPDYKVCDCSPDCSDGSDEMDCSSTPSAYYIRRCDDGHCISEWDICDDYIDCSDGSDEKNCTDNSDCYGFTCNSGQCISSYNRCNMQVDCTDGSDEIDCATFICPSFKFQCGTGHCIYLDSVCNGREDCADGSDEVGCDTSNSCDEFLCSSGECVSDYQLCDGIYHCEDRRDESICQAVTCPANRPYKCDSGQCIYASDFYNPRCNGYKDCQDGSDEMECTDATCPADKSFRCRSGECIYSFWVCDRILDCADGSDEIGCDCLWYSMVSCDSGRCLPDNSRCNGIWECTSGNDESMCTNFTCPYQRPFKCGSNVCLSDTVFCNEGADCPENEQEVCQSRECNSYEIQCDSGECVYGYQCDGRIDCRDRSDEANCQDFLCPENHYKCGSGECIWEHEVCNGYPRCQDASDETHCSNETCPESRGFYCSSGECTYMHWICDGIEDCADGSDETAICETYCPNSFNICNDSRCFPSNWICDGIQDCFNGEDENDCENFIRECNQDQFRCSYDNTCIPSWYVCDNYLDCPDGEDEQNCYFGSTVSTGIAK
nr:low-density lipoprotein receptor-related protein 2-like [Penaeus vannamei]